MSTWRDGRRRTLLSIAQSNGTSLLTLAFVQSTTDGRAAWGGTRTRTPGSSDDQAKAIDASIAAQAAGGDVMVSFGGANGTSLAQYHYTHGGRPSSSPTPTAASSTPTGSIASTSTSKAPLWLTAHPH